MRCLINHDVFIRSQLKLNLTKCCLANVLKQIKIDRYLEREPERRMIYELTIECLPHRCYRNEFSVHPRDVIAKTESKFLKELFREIKKAAKATGSIVYFTEEKNRTKLDESRLDADEAEEEPEQRTQEQRDLGELHESSDEEEMAEDADATLARSHTRHQENREYEDPEEGDEQEENENEEEAEERPQEKPDELEGDGEFDPVTDTINRLQYEQRKLDVVNMYVHVIHYDYDVEKYQWCKVKFWVSVFD